MSRKKKKTKVIPKEPPRDLRDVQPRNFWNTCPRKLEYMPEKPCKMGQKSVGVSSEEDEQCPWGINSKKHQYCFWRWLQDQSDRTGFMEPKKQDEVAALLKWSSTKVHFTCRSAIQNIKKGPHAGVLAELNPGTNADPDTDSNFHSVANQVPSGDSDDY